MLGRRRSPLDYSEESAMRRLRSRSCISTTTPTLVIGLFLLSGCERDAPVVPAKPSATSIPAVAVRAGPLRTVRTIDDEYADLVDEIPGFGGLFYDDAGTLTAYLKDPTTLASARSAVAAFLGSKARGNSRRLAQIADAAAAMRALRANYDFRELLKWYREVVVPSVGATVGVTMTDIDERTNRLVVGVRDASLIESIRQTLAALPVPQDAVEVIQFDASVFETSPGERPFAAVGLSMANSLTDQLRPVPGGAQVQQLFDNKIDTCTLGYNIVRWVDGSIESNRYFVTASHCAYPRSFVAPTSMAQPVGSQFIGTELVDPQFHGSAQNPNCPSGRACRFSDAAMFRYDSPAFADHGRVALPSLGGSLTINGYATVVEVWSPEVGRGVHKVGRVTGRTTGTITHTCANLNVDPANITLLCQGIASYHSQDGDSGAPVVELLGDGTIAAAVGIHWGANGRFSPMYAVLNELYESMPGGNLDPTAPAPPPGDPPPLSDVTLDGPSTWPAGVAAEFTAYPVGGTAPFTYTWLVDGAVQQQSSSSSFTWTAYSSYYVSVTVQDALGATASRSRDVTICPDFYC
jgi:hypothetical protein